MFTTEQQEQIKKLYSYYREIIGKIMERAERDSEKADILMFGTEEEKLKVLTDHFEAVEIPQKEALVTAAQADAVKLTDDIAKLRKAVEDSKPILIEAGLIEETIKVK
jgi:hypothetical protein